MCSGPDVSDLTEKFGLFLLFYFGNLKVHSLNQTELVGQSYTKHFMYPARYKGSGKQTIITDRISVVMPPKMSASFLFIRQLS